MLDRGQGAGAIPPLVGPLLCVAVGLLGRLNMAAEHLQSCWLRQECVDVPLSLWVLLLL